MSSVGGEHNSITSGRSPAYTILAKLLDTPPASIEILPGDGHEWIQDAASNSSFPFILIEGNLGVPQKALYASYLSAVAIFRTVKFDGEAASSTIDLAASTSILLLANPAHQTALNARKRLVERGHLDAKQELAFTAALLSFKDGSKQSILWHHRIWLFQRLYGQAGEVLESYTPPTANDSFQLILPPEVLRRELSIVSLCCEIYPRNYYAWTHRHFCMETLHSSWSQLSSACLDRVVSYIEIIAEELSNMRRWVEQHVSDHSAVHYLCNLTERFSYASSSNDLPALATPRFSMPEPPRSAVTHPISLVRSYPDHETLWLYLRRTCYIGDNRGNVKELMPVVKEVFGPWADGEGLPTSSWIRDPQEVSRQAFRLLAWQGHASGCFGIEDHNARSVIAGKGGLTEPLKIYWRLRSKSV